MRANNSASTSAATGLPSLLINDTVVAILYLIEHFAQILSEIHGIDFGNHRTLHCHIDHNDHYGKK
ncbi:unnamed protein product (plasmid) [Mycetohabitans rhizoxinica HKI 454]|uniref:Uncharacterized protein n=1 Tax=Mycetohabitans rhizoxinica (strain DSM 19002 / CIP 109453 / HKI 454) TaxID=882378 RepID=E5AW21_MYCRK|nr:unnamed protein product [Mycetohabitans rhizoxinica HKI 454]